MVMQCNMEARSYSIFGENDLLTPVIPNDPRLTFDPIIQIKGIKLMYMHESYGHAMQYGGVIAFLMKMTF